MAVATRSRKKSPASRSASASLPQQVAVKRSVTIRAELDARAHELVGDRGFSNLVNEGLELVLQARGFGEILAEYEAKHGVITTEEIAAASRPWKRKKR